MSPPAWKSPDVRSLKGEWAAGHEQVVGKATLIASVGGQRDFADWTNPDHRLRRLLSEFIGTAGLTFVLSGGAAILARPACTGSSSSPRRPGGRCWAAVSSARWGSWPPRSPAGMSRQAAGFEAIITFGLVLMILNLANAPKLNTPFVPLAVGSGGGRSYCGRGGTCAPLSIKFPVSPTHSHRRRLRPARGFPPEACQGYEPHASSPSLRSR